jgi:hypothetical protein
VPTPTRLRASDRRARKGYAYGRAQTLIACRFTLIRYSVYGHRQPASPLVFWGRFVVGSWCAGHGGLGRVYDSVWTEAYRCTGELERL